jgi:acyl-CoA synthetase (AMP-forming)/AMP-acid ligase II
VAETPQDVTTLIDHWTERYPDTTAVVHGEQTWTWLQWRERIARNAAGLVAEGLRPGDRVAFLDKNHPACMDTTFACLRTGTANAVLNFRLAPDEIKYALNDAKARLLFVGAEFVAVWDAIKTDVPAVERVIVVGGAPDEYESWLAAHEPLHSEHTAAPDDCFLQLYTSGTTGFPKGAMLTVRSMTAHSVASARNAEIGEDAVVMVPMPLFHVGGSGWAITALFQGASIVIVRDINPPALLDELVGRKVTHAFLVPAVFAFLLQVPDVADRDYSAVRGLVYGASPMPLPLLRRCLEVFPTDFYQVYGMTEASGAITSLGPEMHRDPAKTHLLTSAGTAFDGVELAVVEPGTTDPLGPGEPGEVLVRTAQLMSGYWDKPDATEQAITGDGWLRSGDAGYLDEDGYLFITDRIKDMIISGGENIYPVEIERVLAEHPSVGDVAVIGVPSEKWGEVGKAIVVAAPGATVDPKTLLTYCHEQLASYKCPKSVEVVTDLPRNATGKILKRQLRTPYWAQRSRTI